MQTWGEQLDKFEMDLVKVREKNKILNLLKFYWPVIPVLDTLIFIMV